nr:immunoglobulin heavy chain junction region [Mus musculus]MBK4197028.1 immunoglobulin heavy chain junction region [Mus musculus]
CARSPFYDPYYAMDYW